MFDVPSAEYTHLSPLKKPKKEIRSATASLWRHTFSAR